MKYRTRIYYTEEQKAVMWERWQKGDSLHSIARLFDRGHSSIARILSETGGIRPPKRIGIVGAQTEGQSRALPRRIRT